MLADAIGEVNLGVSSVSGKVVAASLRKGLPQPGLARDAVRLIELHRTADPIAKAFIESRLPFFFHV